MIFTNQIDESYCKIYPTAEDLAEFSAVTLTKNGVKLCAADEIPFGIVLNDALAGDEVTVQIRGAGYWLAGAALNAGDFLTSDASGQAIKAAKDKFIFAQALKNAAAGEACEVLIIRCGYATGEETADDDI